MNKVIAGVLLGIAGAIWVAAFSWAHDIHIQAAMIFIGIVSGAQAVSGRERSDSPGVYRD
jgi:hypothetical protein